MPGQFYDAESSLFYNWNRYYNPAIGRYISSDPIGLEGGINTFLYAGANPVMAIDPEGLQQEAGILACAIGPNPVCIGSIITTCAKWTAIGVSAGVVAACYSDQFDCMSVLNNNYPENPANTPGKFRPAGKGTPAKENIEDGSEWEPDYSGHGGSEWKRWPDKKSWEKDKDRESVRPDGTVR